MPPMKQWLPFTYRHRRGGFTHDERESASNRRSKANLSVKIPAFAWFGGSACRVFHVAAVGRKTVGCNFIDKGL